MTQDALRILERKQRPGGKLRWVVWIGGVLVIVGFTLAQAIWWRLIASLPIAQGQVKLATLAAPVAIERDRLGHPSLAASSLRDAMCGLGWLHAQERFFQMDLLRRYAAGELAELLGPALLPADRQHRWHRFRARLARRVETLPADDLAILKAYVVGVNAGLAALRQPPPEYLLLSQKPQLWRAEDSLLVVAAMYLQLQGDSWDREYGDLLMQRHLPPGLVAIFTALGDEFDAALDGSTYPPVPLPAATEVNLRDPQWPDSHPAGSPPPPPLAEPAKAGSNSWAVKYNAMIANDMHLGLKLPNIWMRSSWRWKEPANVNCFVDGVSLPGVPGLVVGSSHRIAWGFTNSEGDWADLVDVSAVTAEEKRRQWVTIPETLHAAGGVSETLDVVETPWGPLVPGLSQKYALRWVAHDPEGFNLEFLKMMTAESVEKALAIAGTCGIPHQNLLVADENSRLAWTIMGRIPRRGFDGRVAGPWCAGTRDWAGYRSPAEQPRIVDPPSGILWTANNRVVGGEALAIIGVAGGYDRGLRAGRIRDRLMKLENPQPSDLLAIACDDVVPSLAFWRDEYLRHLPEDDEVRVWRAAGPDFSLRADTSSPIYEKVQTFRATIRARLIPALLAPAIRNGLSEDRRRRARDESLIRRLIREQPLHLLPRSEASWPRFLERVAREARTNPDRILPHVQLRHPLGSAVPFLSRWLDLPLRALPGGRNDVIRVQTERFGASERLVASARSCDFSILHLPGGSSGHFLSPHYASGHQAWENGEPLPLWPGRSLGQVLLVPE